MTQAVCPFCTLVPERILIANDHGLVFRDGFPAAVVNHLSVIHQDCGGQWSRVRLHPKWKSTIGAISTVIRNMPLRYLQVVGRMLVPFLYDFPAPHLDHWLERNERHGEEIGVRLAEAGFVNIGMD